MKKSLLLFFGLAFLVLSCNKEKESSIETALTVSGYLNNGKSPVANAIIDIDDLVQYQVASNTEGFFEIKNVTSGSHKLNYKVGSDEGSFSKITETIEINDDLFLDSRTLPNPVTLYDPEIQNNLESNNVTLFWNKYIGTDFREYKLYKHSSSGLDETTGELLHIATAANDTVFTITLPYASETYFRIFVRDDFDLLGGSNIIELAIGFNTPEPEITVGIQMDNYLSLSEEQELYFDTPEAGLYSIAWFDEGFDEYSAGSILVSALNDDKSQYYFQNERLIQMTGAPLPIYVQSGERVHLGVKGYNESISGTYGLKVRHLQEEDGSSLTIGTPSNVLMNLGETQLLFFEAEANKEYEIVVGNTIDGGAYDDGTETQLSIFEQGEDSFSVYKNSIPFPCCGATKTFPVSVESTKKIYLIIDAAYWFKANTVNIVVNEL